MMPLAKCILEPSGQKIPEFIDVGKTLALAVVCILIGIVLAGCVSEISTKPAETPELLPIKTQTQEPRGSYTNPASIGETVVVKTFSGTFEVAVLDYIKGEKAYQIIKTANMFNPDPDQGFEYLLVKVRFKYASGKTSQYVSAYSFEAYCNGTGYSPAFVVLPKDMPEFKNVNIMPGGMTEGWIAFIVPQGKDILIAYEHMFEPVCFIKV
ncbi:DUF4352 domain-containing protein [Archaeoglobus veneficus]|uniref:DUF4352 domain-containing protein n=1 Tax=Archaeoglobus veneficus (strain DSM 11195 / SNP6) TaxID=693661 RepID=F2KS32_ARCVS|nr:DUF4352 domain-containing protein [Archaeoglobus veneficus]AEA46873.1 hypothetical protein Arcve_0859 [Archaeoglobus veneficus SNP6]